MSTPDPLTTWLHRPALLASVRNCDEALAALEGGAHVIDVKEPRRGPMGRADAARVAEVVVLAAGRAPVTAAGGDWGELPVAALADWTRRAGAALVKLGLPAAPLGPGDLRCLARVRQAAPPGVRLAPVLYADRIEPHWPGGPQLDELNHAFGGGWLVVDTHEKRAGGLLEHWTPAALARVIEAARSVGVRLAVAGGLAGPALWTVARLRPDLVGVRGALCVGGREGRIDPAAVRRAVSLATAAGRKNDEPEKKLTPLRESGYSEMAEGAGEAKRVSTANSRRVSGA